MVLEGKLRAIKRGTTDLFSEEELISKLKLDRPLNIKFGIDPTAPDIHLGHTVPLQKLKYFQDEGHNIHLIIGDYTAMIGDPSGRSETRPMLTREQIEHNLKTYTEQVFKILDPSKTNLFYNSEWFSNFSGEDMIKLATRYSVQQLLQRRDFSNRMAENKPLSVSELIYPLLVGYDSVHLQTDIELGGSDQLFNFMVSRSMQVSYNQTPEVILILPLLEGLDGEKKMSKSLGNTVGVTDEPFDMYGKLMSITDNLMLRYFELLSEVSIDELTHITKVVNDLTENPMKYKKQLARELVVRYHGVAQADYAGNRFANIHQNRIVPENIGELNVPYNPDTGLSLINLIKAAGRASSNSEARRLIEQNGVKLNGQVISDISHIVVPTDGAVLQIGKRYFTRLNFETQ